MLTRCWFKCLLYGSPKWWVIAHQPWRCFFIFSKFKIAPTMQFSLVFSCWGNISGTLKIILTSWSISMIKVTPMVEEAHAKIFNLESGHSFVCSNIFHKYWTQSHYLAGAKSCDYKEGDLFKGLYLNENEFYSFWPTHRVIHKCSLQTKTNFPLPYEMLYSTYSVSLCLQL